MTASRLGTMMDDTQMTLEEVTCDSDYVEGILVTDQSQVTMRGCSINATDFAVTTGGTATLIATDCSATSLAPAWDLNGYLERLSGCRGQGLSVAGEYALVADHVVTGVCDDFGMRLAGSNNSIIGGEIACIANVGLWSDGAVCGRASQLKIMAEYTTTTNLDQYAVQVTGVNTEPEVMLDGIDICGPGITTYITYGCNVEPNDCSGDPCDTCEPLACDEDSPVGDGPPPEYRACTDENCWPPVELREQAMFSTCTGPAGLWDVQVPIKCTRSLVLSLPDLTVGGISDIWRSNPSFDCLVEAELNVWTDDPPSDVGATTVELFDDAPTVPFSVAILSVGAGGTVDWEWTNYSLAGFEPGLDHNVLRAEVLEVTTPLTTVQASITLRFP
jgi:hypothetical protein